MPKDPKTETALFADDTSVYVHSWKIGNAKVNLENHADDLQLYFETNKIKINNTKTEFIIYSRKSKEKRQRK